MLQLHKNNVIVNNEFTYPKFMTQNDRDFQKVLQALTSFDKKLSNLETIVKKMAEANYNYASSQQELNKQQSELNKDLGEGIKMLGNSMSDIIQFLQKIGGKN
jgi:flagellar basal body P-ring protein FlgI